MRYQDRIVPPPQWSVEAQVLCTDYRGRFWLIYLAQRRGFATNEAALFSACITNSVAPNGEGLETNAPSVAMHRLSPTRCHRLIAGLVDLGYQTRYPTQPAEPLLDDRYWIVCVTDTKADNLYLWYTVPNSNAAVEAILGEMDDVAGGHNRILGVP